MTESVRPGGRWRKYTRRAFLITAVTVGGGAAVGLGLLSRFGKGIPEDFADGGSADAVALNAWVRIEPDGTIALAIPRAEMGQGVGTALAMLMAEELEVSLERVVLEHPAAHGVYANYALMLEDSGLFHKEGHPMRWVLSKVAAGIPFIVTGGSSSIVDGWKSMRQVGAAARHMLVEAAATRWGVSPESCKVEVGEIIHPDGNARLGYPEVAAAAAKLEPPSSPTLKPETSFRLVGKSQARLDIPEKVTGRARFGIDVQLAEMLPWCSGALSGSRWPSHQLRYQCDCRSARHRRGARGNWRGGGSGGQQLACIQSSGGVTHYGGGAGSKSRSPPPVSA